MSKTTRKIGLPPGSLVFAGENRPEKVNLEVFDFDENHLTHEAHADFPSCSQWAVKPTTTWLNIDGIHDPAVMTFVGKQYRLHTLLLEDVMNPGHRPKLEEYEGHLFFTLKMLSLKPTSGQIETEQVSVVLGKNWVISFLEHPGDIFDPIRDRIKQNVGRVRQRHCDYLVYLLLDSVIDNYFLVSDHLEGVIDKMENEILYHPTEDSIRTLQRLKKDIIYIRKSISPLREEVAALAFRESDLVEKRNMKYFKDLYDHIVHVLESLDSSKDMLNTLFEMYHHIQSTRMNQVMKVLTIIATIFIPLTFIVGIYGMNFDPEAGSASMPELSWKYGYVTVWAVMIIIVIGMFIYFKRKKWLE